MVNFLLALNISLRVCHFCQILQPSTVRLTRRPVEHILHPTKFVRAATSLAESVLPLVGLRCAICHRSTHSECAACELAKLRAAAPHIFLTWRGNRAAAAGVRMVELSPCGTQTKRTQAMHLRDSQAHVSRWLYANRQQLYKLPLAEIKRRMTQEIRSRSNLRSQHAAK